MFSGFTFQQSGEPPHSTWGMGRDLSMPPSHVSLENMQDGIQDDIEEWEN